MGFLNYCLPLIILLTLTQSAFGQNRPFVDFDFSGIVQGRGVAFLSTFEKPSGPLDTFEPGAGAGGTNETTALLSKCEFTITTPFFFNNTMIVTKSSIGGYKATIKEAYLNYQANRIWIIRAGLIPVPFGSELQQSSDKLDTIERSAIYGFGNYGWIQSFGFDVVKEQDYGVRSDWIWPALFADMKPFMQTALVTGSGKTIRASAPLQWVGRIGVENSISFESFKHELILGLSGSHGYVKTDSIQSTYIPIGNPGDRDTHPQNLVSETSFNTQEHISIFGTDVLIRMNDLVLKGEWMIHRIADYYSQGYTATACFELGQYIKTNISIIAKWEEIIVGFADGAHQPDLPYQVATAGLNWIISSDWKWQLNYIALLTNKEQHQFYGSDLLLMQLQFTF